MTSSSGGGNGGSGGLPPPPPLPLNSPPIADASEGEPYYGFVGEEITFDGSLSHDPDEEDIVSWHWDFGDGTSGTGKITTHIYSGSGTYLVVLTVSDDKGAEDTYETTAVISQPNRIPSAPDVDGPQDGTQNTEYTYTAVSTDGDDVKYHIDWGDDNSVTTGFNPSGTDVQVKHTWSEQGTYTIKAKAEDVLGAKSPERTLTVTMPRNKALTNPLFMRLLERFPYAFPILRHMLGL